MTDEQKNPLYCEICFKTNSEWNPVQLLLVPKRVPESEAGSKRRAYKMLYVCNTCEHGMLQELLNDENGDQGFALSKRIEQVIAGLRKRFSPV